MGKLFGALAAFSVAVAIIFYLVVQTQERHELKTDQMSAEFSRDWNEWNSDFSHNKRDRQIYQQRAQEADKKLHSLGPRADVADQQREQDLQEIQRAVHDYSAASHEHGGSSIMNVVLKFIVIVMLAIGGIMGWKWYQQKQRIENSVE